MLTTATEVSTNWSPTHLRLPELNGTSMGLPEADIVPEAIREEAGLDSLAVAEHALVLRREHGLVVTVDEITGADTLADLVSVVDRAPVAAR